MFCASRTTRYATATCWRGCFNPETHGIGGASCQWFVNHFNERADKAGIGRVLVTDFEASNIDVKRELHHVDITVFFKREKAT